MSESDDFDNIFRILDISLSFIPEKGSSLGMAVIF